MHKLNRPTAPDELVQARRTYNGTPPQDEAWSDFEKDATREELKQAQSSLCAYCEISLNDKTNIDHFKPKRMNYALTFDWDNLVLSCDEKGSCDNKKGGKFENYWINPYSTDPSGMFKFYSDGQIEGNSPDAQNIIIDFGLNCPRLEKKREGVLTSLSQTILALESEPEALEYFLQEEAVMFPTAYIQIINNLSGE